MLYLDNSATTPPYPEVVSTVADVMGKHFGNPSSIHRLGMEAERLLHRSRKVIAETLSCKSQEIIFTASGSESNNLAIKGAVYRYQNRGKHLITSEIEHASVYECYQQLKGQGFEITFLPVDQTGSIRLDDLAHALREDTILVSLMYVNNEVGRIQPIEEAGRMLQDYPRVLFHVDAIQAYGKLDCSAGRLGADLLSVSAHKYRGPKGAGFLYCREGIELVPLIAGGGQEQGIRSGTENVPLLVGMAKASRMATEEIIVATPRLYQLRQLLIKQLQSIEGLTITGSSNPVDMAPHIVHFVLSGIRSEVMVHALEEAQIYISARSACASGAISPSRVLLAMGKRREEATNGLRVSLSAQQTEAEIQLFIKELCKAVARLRRPDISSKERILWSHKPLLLD
ncbi:MAG: cysteine desulfurase [Gorillibacterium sp.]|nr:cysteine desulfurase [Gorillibacterium sp.]